MSLRTKNRQKQTADLCKQYLRGKYPDKPTSVEEFIVEIEGPPQNCDLTRWGQFTEYQGHQKRDVPTARDSIRELAQSMNDWLGLLEQYQVRANSRRRHAIHQMAITECRTTADHNATPCNPQPRPAKVRVTATATLWSNIAATSPSCGTVLRVASCKPACDPQRK
jgi:hypothetical protein